MCSKCVVLNLYNTNMYLLWSTGPPIYDPLPKAGGSPWSSTQISVTHPLSVAGVKIVPMEWEID